MNDTNFFTRQLVGRALGGNGFFIADEIDHFDLGIEFECGLGSENVDGRGAIAAHDIEC